MSKLVKRLQFSNVPSDYVRITGCPISRTVGVRMPSTTYLMTLDQAIQYHRMLTGVIGEIIKLKEERRNCDD